MLKDSQTPKRDQTVEDYTKANNNFAGFGGQFVPEVLMPELFRLEKEYDEAKKDPEFQKEFHRLLNEYANRPSLLYYAKNMTEDIGGAKIYLKREDLNHTGAHKINNALGQALLAKRLGKTRLIAETGAGQHGVATATVAALFGMDCEIFMGKKDTERQKLNVYRMQLLGAKVVAVDDGQGLLKDAINATLADWAANLDTTYYLIGSAVGPAPYPKMVHDFQSVISTEARQQFLDVEGRLPDAVVACVGGGSNAIGSFAAFIDDPGVKLYGAEAAGKGADTPYNAATMENGTPGIFHGMKSLFLQNKDGQIDKVYSISAGLDYPGIGPEHVALQELKRATYVGITDEEAVSAFEYIAKQEGIIAAIESSHAVAYTRKLAATMKPDQIIMCTLSGRGDKDVAAIAKYRGVEIDD